MKKMLFFLFTAVGLLFLSLGFIQNPNSDTDSQRHFSEKVNLAFRQTGHQLLQIQGDNKSLIPPITELREGEFVLTLECGFEYDSLPKILENALADFGIERSYRVAVRSCGSDLLVLGYNYWAVGSGDVACGGRDRTPECSDIYLSFEEKVESNYSNIFSIIGLGLIGFVLFFQVYFFKNQKVKTVSTKVAKDNFIKIGNSEFDFSNQTIVVSDSKKSLTFRENKLLHFFALRQNQVLERETISSNVWGDEGVIVGRSLDVFVSRLRKILKEDSAVQIKNIHGVGYRMETSV